MTIKDKITDKEKNIRELIDMVRSGLNAKRIVYNQNPNDWSYLASLSHAETKLNEIVEFFKK